MLSGALITKLIEAKNNSNILYMQQTPTPTQSNPITDLFYSIIASRFMHNLNPDPNSKAPDSSNSNPYFYSWIVLCVKDKPGCFNCKKFESFAEADKYFEDHYCAPYKTASSKCKKFESIAEADKYFHDNCKNKKDYRHMESTIVPMSKLIPTFLQPYVLQFKMANMFSRICLGSDESNKVSKNHF